MRIPKLLLTVGICAVVGCMMTTCLTAISGGLSATPVAAAPLETVHASAQHHAQTTQALRRQTPVPATRLDAATAPLAPKAAVSGAPCVFYASGSCVSTSSQVWIYINTNFLAGFCTVAFTVNWGDGTSLNSTRTTVFGELAVLLGIHSFPSSGAYSVQVTASVQSGPCVFAPYQAQDAVITPASRSLVPSNVQGGGSPDIPPTTCSCGAPVNTDTGEFWHTFTDLAVPGRGIPLDLSRTYSSAASSTLGPLGYGWTDGYAMSLSFDGSGNPTIHEENSSSVTGLLSGTTYIFPSEVLATLVKDGDGTFTFTRRDGSNYVFSANGQLVKEVDRNRYATTLTYGGSGQLTKVTDPAGRTLTFAHGSNGLVSSVTDPASRVVNYTYDASKNLTAMTDVGGKKWLFAYDGNHLMLTMTDPRGGVTTNTYDTTGRVLSQSDPLGRLTTYAYAGVTGSASSATTMKGPRGTVTQFRYSSNELMSTQSEASPTVLINSSFQYDATTLGRAYVTDPNGHVNSTEFDAWGNPIRVIDPLGRTTTSTFNALNEPLTITDPKGVTTSFAYDVLGNLLSKTTGTRSTTLSYGDPAHPGDATSSTDPDGKTTSYSYDANGDLMSTTDPLGHVATATYDDIGRKLTSTSPNGGVNTDTYDPFGDVLTSTDPLGHKTTNTYDADRNLLSTKDPVGNTTKFVYDADNELTKTTRPGNKSSSSTYDADGNAATTTDAAGHITADTYDLQDRLLTTTDPLGHVSTNTYDYAGNRITQVNPSGKTTTSTYNADNEATGITYSDGVTHGVTYAYDADGRRTSMTDGTGTTSYTYDALGQLTASTNGAVSATGYSYDAKGQLTSLTYPNGHSVAQGYDASGNLISVTDWLGHTITYAYDGDGNPTTQTVPSTTPVVDTTSYNAADQITSISDVAGAATLQGFAYTRTANSLVSSVIPTGQPTRAYAYDSLSQLTKDPQGKYKYAADGAVTSLLGTKPMTYNAADQLVSSVTAKVTSSYTYDAQGNRLTAVPATGTATDTTFNQAGVMAGLTNGTTTAAYIYNGDGLRMGKTVSATTTGFTWDLASAIPLLLTDGSASYVYGPSGLPLEQITASGVLYYHHDQLGSTTMLTDQASATVATYTYDSYGQHLTTTGSSSNPLQFAGQYRDSESGLYYLQARYYDPSTGQFMSVDPASRLTGEKFGYALNDPVNLSDPTGMFSFKVAAELLGATAAVAALIGLGYLAAPVILVGWLGIELSTMVLASIEIAATVAGTISVGTGVTGISFGYFAAANHEISRDEADLSAGFTIASLIVSTGMGALAKAAGASEFMSEVVSQLSSAPIDIGDYFRSHQSEALTRLRGCTDGIHRQVFGSDAIPQRWLG